MHTATTPTVPMKGLTRCFRTPIAEWIRLKRHYLIERAERFRPGPDADAAARCDAAESAVAELWKPIDLPSLVAGKATTAGDSINLTDRGVTYRHGIVMKRVPLVRGDNRFRTGKFLARVYLELKGDGELLEIVPAGLHSATAGRLYSAHLNIDENRVRFDLPCPTGTRDIEHHRDMVAGAVDLLRAELPPLAQPVDWLLEAWAD